MHEEMNQTVETGVSQDMPEDGIGDVPVSQPDDGADDTVSVTEIFGSPSQTTVENGGDDAAGRGDPENSRTAQADTAARSGEFPSQAAINRAIGERLSRERRKWEEQHKGELELARRLSHIHRGSKSEDILRMNAEMKADTMGLTPEQFAYFNQNGASQSAPEQARIAASSDNRALAARIVEESESVREQFPGFDPREFVRSNPEGVARLRAGYSLRDAYMLSNMNTLMADSRRQGETLAAQRIRSRNTRIPEATRGSSGAMGRLDVKHLTDEEFARIENMVSSGRKVRLY